ncbi:CAP domain-containing protein [Paracoccus tegillarcae]|nr:CAP domain-containing protein [Paracoccus tegillarcae]
MAFIRLTALTACAGLLAACQPGTNTTAITLDGGDLAPIETGIPADPAAETLAGSCVRDDVQANALIEAVNAVRGAEGKVLLTENARLNTVAQSNSCDMARIGRVQVAGSNGSSIVDRARSVNYPTCGVIQMAWLGGSAFEAVATGMRSDAHREQLLGQLSDEIGAGITRGADGRNWWSLVIGDNCR